MEQQRKDTTGNNKSRLSRFLDSNILCITGEENSSFSNNSYEWSFGNGLTSPLGSRLPIPYRFQLTKVTINNEVDVNSTVTVEIQVGDYNSDNYVVVGVVAIPVGSSQGVLNISDGDLQEFNINSWIRFRTITGGNGRRGNVNAYLNITSHV